MGERVTYTPKSETWSRVAGDKGRFAGGNLVCGLNDNYKYNNTLQAISQKNKKNSEYGHCAGVLTTFPSKTLGRKH